MSTHTSPPRTDEDPLIRQARRRVKLKAGFFIHALAFTLVNLGWMALHVSAGSALTLHLPVWGWSLGLAIHGVVVLARLNSHGLHDRLVAREVERLRAAG